MSASSNSPSIAQLISLTLGAVGVGLGGGCASDPDPDTNTNTTTTNASVGEDSSSSADTGTQSDSSYSSSYNDDYYNPCAGWDPDPIVVDIDVVDWVLTSMTYESLVTQAELVSGQDWNNVDDATRCLFACAFATGYLGFDPNYSYGTFDLSSCELSIPTVDMDGVLQCTGTRTYLPQCPGGRAPLGWSSSARGDGGLADHLDAMATMEAVSITAFGELAAQLQRLGAPVDLIERCHAAAGDEARHLALLEQLGGRGPTQLPAPAPAETSALAIARHNAVEGCVSETWAALLARHQSQHAADARTREAFAIIAEDEGRHAQLAWDVHGWLCGLLTADEVARVESSRAEALAKLDRVALQQALAIDAAARRQLGLPAPRRAARLAQEFGRQLAAA